MINFYCELLLNNFPNSKIFAFNPRLIDLFEQMGSLHTLGEGFFAKNVLTHYERLLLPINLNNTHWVCFMIHFTEVDGKRVTHLFYFDSFGTPPSQKLMERIKALLVHLNSLQQPPLLIQDSLRVSHNTCRMQGDGHSCGPFICSFMKHVFTTSPLELGQVLSRVNRGQSNMREQMLEEMFVRKVALVEDDFQSGSSQSPESDHSWPEVRFSYPQESVCEKHLLISFDEDTYFCSVCGDFFPKK